MRTLLASIIAVALLLGIAPNASAQAAYYDHGKDGIGFGYIHESINGVSADGGTMSIVAGGMVEVGVGYSSVSTLSAWSIGLEGYPIKQGRKRAPMSLGLGAALDFLHEGSGTAKMVTAGILQNYRLDIDPQIFLVQHAQLAILAPLGSTGDSEPFAGLGLELVISPGHSFFLGIGYHVTFIKDENPNGVNVTLSIPLPKSGSEDETVDW